jgi:hypothetical protein
MQNCEVRKPENRNLFEPRSGGEVAAIAAAEALCKVAAVRESFGVIFATGTSQLGTISTISSICPSTIPRTHPDATLHLDDESAAEITDLAGHLSG